MAAKASPGPSAPPTPAEDPRVEAALSDGAGAPTDDPAVSREVWIGLRQRWRNTLTQVKAEFRVAMHVGDEATKKAAVSTPMRGLSRSLTRHSDSSTATPPRRNPTVTHTGSSTVGPM